MCGIPERTLPEILDGRRYVVLDGVQDPGNVGTILRTADAFQADGVFLLPGCADLYNPKTVRATMGAVFRFPVWSCTPEQLREINLRIYNTHYAIMEAVLAHDPDGADRAVAAMVRLFQDTVH